MREKDKTPASPRTTALDQYTQAPEESEFPQLSKGCPRCSELVAQGHLLPRDAQDLAVEQRIGPYIVARCRREGCGWRGEMEK